MGNEDDNPTKTCGFQPLSPTCLLVSLNAKVMELVVVVGCMQGPWSQVSTFSCYSHRLLWLRMPLRGMKTNFKNLCVCFAKIKSPAPVFVRIPGSHHPGTWLCLVPGFRDQGSVLILRQLTQYGNPYSYLVPIPIPILNLYSISVQIWKSWLQSAVTYRTNKLISSKWVKFWLFNLTSKARVNRPTKTIGILTKVFHISGPNLVILA